MKVYKRLINPSDSTNRHALAVSLEKQKNNLLHVPRGSPCPPLLLQTHKYKLQHSRASNLTLTEAACVTFSAITSWESQPIEPCYPAFGRLKKEAALPPAQVTPLTTDVSESYLRGFYRPPATRRICYLSIADTLFQPELPPLSRSCPA